MQPLRAVENVTQLAESFLTLFGDSQKMLTTMAAAALLNLVYLIYGRPSGGSH